MPTVLQRMTVQERKVVEELTKGKNQTQIAGILFVSLKRIEQILSKLRERYDCQTTPQLIDFLHKNNLINNNSENIQ